MDGRTKNLVCEIEDCNNFVYRRTLCSTHYNKQLPKKLCSVEKCQDFVRAKQLCRKHYYQRFPERIYKSKEKCLEDNCSKFKFARGLCVSHYDKLRKEIEPEYREKRNKQSLDYYHRNLENSRLKGRMNNRKPVNRYTQAIWQSKKRGIPWDLSFQEFETLILLPCEYCASIAMPETGSGLDRKDNSKGYVIDNVVPCCKVCNEIKNQHLTYGEMKVGMKAIKNYRQLTLSKAKQAEAAAQNPNTPKVFGGDNTGIVSSTSA